MKTIVVHIPKRCKNPKMEIFDESIDMINNSRSKKYLFEDTTILAMGTGGKLLIDYYNEKYFGKKKKTEVKSKKKRIKNKKKSVDKNELKKAINKQKEFLNGKVDKSFW